MKTLSKFMKQALMGIALTQTLVSVALAGNSGGGGNLKPGKPVPVVDVRQYLEKLRIPLIIVFKYFSVAKYNSQQGYMGTIGRSDVDNLLYNSKLNIFDKINNVPVTIVEDGSCVWDGKVDDGSAHTSPDRVCLDAARIAANPKVGEYNVFVSTLALAAHEYAHLVGANEEQAEAVQHQVLKDVSENMAEEHRSWLRHVPQELDEAFQAFQTVINDLNNKVDWSQTCYDLAMAQTHAAYTVNKMDNTGYNGRGLLTRTEWNEALPTLYGSPSSVFICKNDDETKLLKERVFGQNQRIPVMEFLRRFHPHSSGNIEVQGYVERKDYHDKKAVVQYVREFQAMLMNIKSKLPK